MQVLQQTFDQVMERVPKQILINLISRKFAAQGVRLSAKEKQALTQSIFDGNSDTFQIQRHGRKKQKASRVAFTKRDVLEFDRRIAKFFKKLPQFINKESRTLAANIFVRLKERWPGQRQWQRNALGGFRRRLQRRWREGLELLEMLVIISREFGSDLNDEFRSLAYANQKHKVEVLTRLHARSCQVGEEILALLNHGFADGASARWRTLHEIAVTALFISANNDDLAERYILHQVVESRRAAAEYQEACKRLGEKPLTRRELRTIEASYQILLKRFGREFKEPYGWAAHQLQTPRPTLKDIEKAAGIDHLRPYYRMASHNVHANPKGVFFKLGLLSRA